MATILYGRRAASEEFSVAHLVNDRRHRSIFFQILVFAVIVWGGWQLYSNVSANLEACGMLPGFGFLSTTAGFSIAWTVIPFSATDTYGYVYLIGILNTMVVSLIAIVATTAVGFTVGILRLSRNWLISTIAAWYVEIVRHTPRLLQILFWYLGVFSLLPRPKQSIDVLELGVLQLNNRGIYFPEPQPGEVFWLTGITVVVAIAMAYALAMWSKRRFIRSDKRFAALWRSLGLLVGLPLLVFLITGSPLSWQLPVLQGFNFVGGASVPPSFCALLVALVVYHATHIAQSVRAGILSIEKGQTEASYSLGLKPDWTLRLIIIPQAMRAVLPILISICGAVVKILHSLSQLSRW